MMWSVNKYTLQLKCKIILQKYNEQSYKLPPEELGICKNWRFETINSNETLFWASWDLRQINRNIDINNISKKLYKFIIQE